jgi:hypothetical protein
MTDKNFCCNGKEFHTFTIEMNCERCHRAMKVTKTYKCKSEGEGTMGWIRRIGCKVCKGDSEIGTHVGMAFYCNPGGVDRDYAWFPQGNEKLYIAVINTDKIT